MHSYQTKQRKALLDYLLAHADETVTAPQIALALRDCGVSLSAVYRNLASLEAEGHVRRSSKEGSRTVCYRYIDAKECRKHLHLSCVDCGKTYHMDAAVSDALIRIVARDAHFAVDRTGTVLYGVCEGCRRRQEKGHCFP